MTPTGTSNELDVQNEWEENTRTSGERLNRDVAHKIPGLFSVTIFEVGNTHWPSRLGQWVSFPEVKALHDAIEANKAAAARCQEKVAQVEGAMANTALVLNI